LFPDGEFSIAMGQTELPRKPDPTVPLWIAEQLNASAGQCVLVGDSEVDIQTAKNAGMYSIGCAWGYRDRQTLAAAGADVIIQHPDELLGALDTISSSHDERKTL
jgi:phosphoglycolate phosphatase